VASGLGTSRSAVGILLTLYAAARCRPSSAVLSEPIGALTVVAAAVVVTSVALVVSLEHR